MDKARASAVPGQANAEADESVAAVKRQEKQVREDEYGYRKEVLML